MNKIFALLLSCSFCLAATVSNSSFESQNLPNNSSVSAPVTDWPGYADNIMVKKPSQSGLQPSDGENYLSIGTGFNQLKQAVLTIQADSKYTFQIDVGIEGDFDSLSGDWYRCALVYEGQSGNEFIDQVNHTNQWPANNGWITVVLELSTFEQEDLIGKNLQVMLTGQNICFDNVRFSYEPGWDGVFNGSFEYDVLADGDNSVEFPFSGWMSNGADIKNPLSSEPLQPSDGDNYCRVINGSAEYYTQGGIYPQTKYEVDIDVAISSELNYGWYQVRLVYYNGSDWVVIAEVNQNNYPLYVADTWRSVHLEFTSTFGNWFYPSNIGQLLRIQLNGQGVAYDNCRIKQTILRSDVSTFYISSSEGSDSNDGLSSESPWQSFDNINKLRLLPGDKVLLKRGDTFTGQLHLWGDGDINDSIELSAYGTGDKPEIIAGDKYYGKCIVLESPEYWNINNVECREAKLGIYLRYNQAINNKNVVIENCDFYDMNQIEYWDPAYYDYELSFNAGIMVGGKLWNFNVSQNIIENLTIRNCRMINVTHGFLANWYYPPRYRNRIKNLVIEDCVNTGGYGFGIFHTNGGHMSRCYFYDGETGFMPTGTCQGILQTSKNFTIDSCVFSGTSRQGGTADGCGFDFEGDTENCVFSNNVAYNCDGQSLLILGTGGPNKNLFIKDSVFFNNCKDALHWSGHNYEMTAWDDQQQGTFENLTFYTQSSDGIYSNPAYFENFTKNNVVELPYSQIKDLTYYWHFNTEGFFEDWRWPVELDIESVSGGSLNMASSGYDPHIYTPDTWVVAAANPMAVIRYSSTLGNTGRLYFVTKNDTLWNEEKSVSFDIVSDGQLHRYDIDMFTCASYKGVITQIRIDPTDMPGSQLAIDYLKFGYPQSGITETSYYPESFTVSSGSWLVGDVDKLRQKEFCFSSCYNPDDYIAFMSNSPSQSIIKIFDFSSMSSDSQEILLDIQTKTDVSGVLIFEMYNYQQSSWQQLTQFNVDEEYSVGSYKFENLAFISNLGNARVRFELVSTSSNSIYYDYIKLRTTEIKDLLSDMDMDGDVDMMDYSRISEYWGDSPAIVTNGFCEGADVNTDGFVDIDDLLYMAEQWWQ
ncbi:MAG: right-handed parallel beta-helix repeat-containing protein [Sedimentisphaeraceae bacterium JB056]